MVAARIKKIRTWGMFINVHLLGVWQSTALPVLVKYHVRAGRSAFVTPNPRKLRIKDMDMRQRVRLPLDAEFRLDASCFFFFPAFWTSTGVAAIDCRASSLVALNRLSIVPDTTAATYLTHLLGGRFGGLPNLLLMREYGSGAAGSLKIAGPPRRKQCVISLCDAMFTGM